MKTLLKKSKTTSTVTIFAIVSLLLPSVVFAQVKISEVMYDAPGSDSGREWIEVTNLGSQNTDIGKYKLFESGTNHGLKLAQGSGVLTPGASAIIAADPQKFLTDYPAYAGVLFDSAFSLSNTGETLVLKDASSTSLDTVVYTTNSQANGTGGTLNRAGEVFVVAMASPGIYPSPLTPVPAKEKATPTTKVTMTASKSSAQKGSTTSLTEPNVLESNSNTASLLAAPTISEPVLIGLGLVATILLGIAGIFFINTKREETSLSADEFTIE